MRPLARGLSRGELEGVSIVIETFDKAVDPSEAQCLANSVFVRDRLYTRVAFVEDEPHSCARGVVLCQPRPPLLTVSETHQRRLCHRCDPQRKLRLMECPDWLYPESSR